MKTIRHSSVLVAVVALVAIAIPSTMALAATRVPTYKLSAKGGTVKLSATVKNAKTCAWSSSPKVAGFNATVKCKTGKVTRSAKFTANQSTKAKDDTLSLTVRGKTTTVARWKVVEAGKTTPTTTTTPPTTTTTLPPQTSFCVGTSSNCLATFPTADDNDATSLQIEDVYLGVVCPDPGLCDQPAGDQLDEVALAMGTGSSGMSDPGIEMDNFALILPGGSQATSDTVTCDSSVPEALCGLGPEEPNTTFDADVYFDAPEGTSWTQVNFAYTSSDFSSQTVYSFSS